MNILSLIDGMSEEEIGKIIVGEVNSFICEKAQTLLDGLMKNEIIDFFADASNATDGNFRNGYYSRTLNTIYGPLTLRVPRDRIGQFKTKFFVPYKRTTDNICEMIQRLYVRGMTEREIVDEINDDFGNFPVQGNRQDNSEQGPQGSLGLQQQSYSALPQCLSGRNLCADKTQI